jgi:hypothetical protein
MTRAESAGAGLRSILIATAIAGIVGYAIQLLAPSLLKSDSAYVSFSVYWSTLYFFVATLSGVQQEVTRAARPASDAQPGPVLRAFALTIGLVALIAVGCLAVIAGSAILPGPTVLLAVALAVGVVGYIMVAVLSGVLYGLRMWTAVAGLTVLDATFRAVLVIVGFLLAWPPEGLALTISLPFGLAAFAIWLRVRPRLQAGFGLDVGLRSLLVHTFGTVLAAAAMGVMLNGLPMLLGLTSGASDPTLLAGLILAITITRAPIVVPLLAVQSYLISLLRGGNGPSRRRLAGILALSAGGIVLLAALAALIGPWAIGFVSGGRYAMTPLMMAAITAGAGVVALMCITGPALLAQGHHAPYTAGWVVAALFTIGALLVPLPLESRVALTLLVPPVTGLVVHIAAVWTAGVRNPSDTAQRSEDGD